MMMSRRGNALLLLMISLQQILSCRGGCSPSSCGKISNIKHPFRLKNDPASCGDERYELSCENNMTVLYLFPGKSYGVEAINYNNFTIRLVDLGISQNDCSTLPRYSLCTSNFSDAYGFSQIPKEVTEPYACFQDVGYGDKTGLFNHVIFLNCSNPIIRDDDGRFVDASHCIDGKKKGDHHRHVYAGVGGLKVAELTQLIRNDCRVMVAASSVFGSLHRNLSYGEIHRRLSYGFELSWMLGGVCASVCGDLKTCFFNETTQSITCVDYCQGPTQVECRKVSKLQIVVEDFAYGILKGFRKVVGKDTGEALSKKDVLSAIKVGVFTGRILIPYIAVKYTLGVIFFFALLIYTLRRRHLSIYGNIEEFLQHNTLMPIRYSYKEIKKMTQGFKEKLGEGGFGAVYKGKLVSGPFVAIKMLGKAKGGNGQDFISEVATIGRIHHANVVRLIGFCVEGSKRALVYEFMPNGSLDKYIFSEENSVSLTYQKMFEISVGVARGMAYLHEGCDMQILHFDIKPHNILLDENFIPKVSDFGLAKLYPLDNSIVSLTAARGTIGYMAPELFYQNIGAVSYKADVYSFGMLLMEIASQRKNMNSHAEHSSQLYFPFWIYDQLAAKENYEIEIETFNDEEMSELAKKMFITALWCIQLKPSDRPSMNKVVEMLEGDVANIEMPPKPSFYPNDVIQRDSKTDFGESDSNNSDVSYSFEEESITNPLLKFSG
ncbi:hypothetical protein PIB30_030882 [Stylosanthes scabra]|uniref:Protein kinase domain-containing protein n=1 Tax=Stylosanthes scabra TaxID=79078 RepID=A0ABU6XDK4_9FABA|nr:hypothetical protein [Stylosanthes scabra]